LRVPLSLKQALERGHFQGGNSLVLKVGALLLAATVGATTPIQSVRLQQIPAPKTQAVVPQKIEKNTRGQEHSDKPSPLVVEAHVSGKLETTAKNNGQETQSEWDRWLDPFTIFTGLLVLVGAGQVWFLRRTDIATTKAANAAQASADAVVSQLRAYVHLGEIVIEDPDGLNPRIKITAQNTGQTPAYGMTMIATASAFNADSILPLIRPEPTPDTSKIDLTAGPLAQKILPLEKIFLKFPLARLRAGSDILFVYGEILYRDAFKIDRHTRFKFSIGGPLGWPTDNRPIVCPDGNEAN
jgi:hypothetical protein